MKIGKFLGASLLFVALTCLIYWIHIAFFRVDVVFYSALLDGGLAVTIASIVIWRMRAFAVFGPFEKLQMVLIWLLASYALAISVPTVLDRSLSFYILEKLQQRGGGIQQTRFDNVFTKEYLKEHRLVDVRLTEQLLSGTIRIENGCVHLTPKGEHLADLSRFFRAHLLPKQRLLLESYSDDLVNPFRHSVEHVDYLCQ